MLAKLTLASLLFCSLASTSALGEATSPSFSPILKPIISKTWSDRLISWKNELFGFETGRILELPFLEPLPLPNLPIPISTPEDGYLTFYLDNDLFGGTDENYTNGARLSWISGSRKIRDIPTVQKFLTGLSNLDEKQRFYFNYGFSMTQLMFTPIDIFTTTPSRNERPYAGWTGLGFSVHSKNQYHLNSLELTVGIMGPAALAENTQDSVHALRDLPKAQGWENQLRNEVTLNLHYTHKHQWFEKKFAGELIELESYYQYGGDFGNMIISGHVGAYGRIGYNLPADFSAPRLHVTGYSQQLFGENRKSLGKVSVFGFFGFEGRLVLHDIFLDGNVFRSSLSVDRIPTVVDASFGLGTRLDNWTLSFTQTYRSAEYREQDKGQVFGSLALSRAF